MHSPQIISANMRRFIRRRLINVGVQPSHALEISTLFQRQIDNRGLSGAVDYFKRVGDQLVFSISRSDKRSPWVRVLNNAFPAFFVALRDYPEEVLLRVSKIARAIRFPSPTEQQVAKVRDAAEKSYGGSKLGLKRCAKLARLGFSAFGLEPVTFVPDYSKPSLRFVVSNKIHKSLGNATPEDPGSSSQLTRAMIQYLSDPMLRRLPMHQCFYPFTPEFLERMKQVITPVEQSIVGMISATQEGGGKLRMFAAPYTVFQHALYPIHYWIADEFNRHIDNICTWDQTSGAQWAQAHLRLGHVVHSVDLSSATCRWPLEPQLELLRHAGLPDQYVELLERVSRGTWSIQSELRSSFLRSELQWSTGQPLGIAPSMSMFTLTHACVLRGLASELGVEPSFKVLGDDVLIVGDKLHQAYRDILKLMDVPVSEHKSHSSTLVAEFAGYTITADTLVRPGQWRPVHRGNALSLAEELRAPTPGEVTILAKELQEFHLFRLGIMDPPSALLPQFIRMSLLMVESLIKIPHLHGAELLDHAANRIVADTSRAIQKHFRLPYPVVQYGVRVWYTEISETSFIQAIFKPLSAYHTDETVRHFMLYSKVLSLGNHSIIALQPFISLFSLWERGLVADDELIRLLDAIKGTYYNFLYFPRSRKAKVEMDGLYDRYLDLYKRASPDPFSIWERAIITKYLAA